jgi:hypothetical protein
MKTKVFSIRDSKGNLFNTPFCKMNERDATFEFKRLVNDKQSLPGQYPKDFDLYLLGEYDDQTGRFTSLDQPQHLAEGITQVEQSSTEKPLTAVQ